VPNPFSGQTTINYHVPTAGRVTLRVYDLTGQLVRTLVDRRLALGSHSAVWDGSDEAERRVSAGAYFYKLQVGSSRAARRMTHLR
jgi:flagellar hook assembly protein FlgD